MGGGIEPVDVATGNAWEYFVFYVFDNLNSVVSLAQASDHEILIQGLRGDLE
jgi:hypothetical protein